MYHSFVLLLRCHVDDKNLDPLCRNRTTALRLNKQVLTPISTPGLVGPESASKTQQWQPQRARMCQWGPEGYYNLDPVTVEKKKKRQQDIQSRGLRYSTAV